MKAFVGLIAVVAVIGIFGYSAGWWAGNVKTENKSGITAHVEVDKDQIMADRDRFVGETKDKLAELDAKIEKLSGDAKGKSSATIETAKKRLKEQREAAMEQLESAKKATKDTWKDIKVKADRAFKDLSDGVSNALDEIKK